MATQYTKQLKEDAVRYWKEHPELGIGKCAKNLGISKSTLSTWGKMYEANVGDVPTRGRGNFESDEAKKMEKLRKELQNSYTVTGDIISRSVPRFSTYGVACKGSAPVFTDITGHWAKEDITFVAARGLLSGTGKGLFSPDGAITREMFVTALGRLAGINPDSYQTRSFTDVKADACYGAYVEWAAQKNIVKGTGDKLFSPDGPVTREQMAVIMASYAGRMGYSIPTPLTAAAFADNDKISEWAAKEVSAMQRAGIVKGKDGNRFDPQASATRAEVSAVLRRFVEIIIDSSTAAGWRKIGGRWYYFDENGVMAVNTKIDGREVGPDGVRKEDFYHE